METQKQIIVDRGVMKRLCSEFGVSISPVRMALRGKVTTATHMRLRKRAIELGGIELKNE